MLTVPPPQPGCSPVNVFQCGQCETQIDRPSAKTKFAHHFNNAFKTAAPATSGVAAPTAQTAVPVAFPVGQGGAGANGKNPAPTAGPPANGALGSRTSADDIVVGYRLPVHEIPPQAQDRPGAT